MARSAIKAAYSSVFTHAAFSYAPLTPELRDIASGVPPDAAHELSRLGTARPQRKW